MNDKTFDTVLNFFIKANNEIAKKYKGKIPEPKYIKIYKKDIRGRFNLTVDPKKFYNPDEDIKTKQCFCQSIYNGETKQVENCTCGKCADSLKTNKKSDWESKFDKEFPKERGLFESDPNGLRKRAILEFISEQIKQAKQDVRQELKKKVEGMGMDYVEKTEYKCKGAELYNQRKDGYNQALSDILTLLEEAKEQK